METLGDRGWAARRCGPGVVTPKSLAEQVGEAPLIRFP
ncbi:hypothetical protein Y88_1336 [Novosphingobium nitrogenifigens DSM 19370]|uniref:Uncharacterized protein n=1 Tax=Novosphingobium nitrogenifigens DSM 19370 TaxID=983920 RepID=F1Z7V0_9SPHN|nr:hypothetical protein Y88_1336 [Novosphingobium nitrogenifigens DSM 19370]